MRTYTITPEARKKMSEGGKKGMATKRKNFHEPPHAPIWLVEEFVPEQAKSKQPLDTSPFIIVGPPELARYVIQ